MMKYYAAIQNSVIEEYLMTQKIFIRCMCKWKKVGYKTLKIIE